MKDVAATLLKFSVSFVPVAMVLILALVITSIVVFFRFRGASDGSPRSGVRFAAGAVAVGIVAGGLGMALGIAFFCSYSLGNLCGLGGVFLTGPVALGLALIVYLYFWAANGRVHYKIRSGVR